MPAGLREMIAMVTDPLARYVQLLYQSNKLYIFFTYLCHVSKVTILLRHFYL